MNKKKIEKWYDNGYIISGLILLVIMSIVISSQAFVNGELTFALFSSVINHNSIYLLVFVYFILLLFPFGKKYFNYLNLFLLFIYFTATVTSLLTLFQSFKLVTVFSFLLNFVLFIYSFHTLLRGTRFWKEFHLASSPFHELTNEGVFYSVIVLSVFLLIVNLINAVVMSGVVLALLDTVYSILLGRYIYLYYEFLDMKNIDSDNDGDFDQFRSNVKEALDKTDVDDVIVEGLRDAKKTVLGVGKKVSEDVEEGIEKTIKDKKKTTRKTEKGE